MNYKSDIIPLLKKYKGMELKSVSGKSDIMITDVNDEEILMICSDGKEFKEAHKRAEIAFNALQKDNYIHVDAAVKNGGSRRNIPETLLANLPFIEHGKIDGKKHLFLNQGRKITHDLGTLKTIND